MSGCAGLWFRGDGAKECDLEACDESGGWLNEVRRLLLAWYGEEKRDLPWRVDRDPYRILVSEVMLVQTTVAAVTPYFERFLRAFPDFKALAGAEEDEVVKAWEGLGYYRRARHLHEAARRVVALHGGVMPEDASAVRALPGVGRYMAGAILSQAFDLPEPILEANSQRVLARLLAWEGDVKAAATKARLWEAAARLVPPRRAGEFNQAVMEFGRARLHSARPPVPGLPALGPLRGEAVGTPKRVAEGRPAARAARGFGILRGGREPGAGAGRPPEIARPLGRLLGVSDDPP